jgi:hypothetical protein
LTSFAQRCGVRQAALLRLHARIERSKALRHGRPRMRTVGSGAKMSVGIKVRITIGYLH